ncbi:hypothetical protein XA68_13964 [Ophiocordyceps unilateralis]|uniref:Uncharacterized protein n=1 Tax=Ophiocordyceps unilateralis TaxID=268505 RepID=A0A2A9PNC4_OPHUN|nr:hypothetical protein XA68_13964 [Ophiocordyceps unilateralis]
MQLRQKEREGSTGPASRAGLTHGLEDAEPTSGGGLMAQEGEPVGVSTCFATIAFVAVRDDARERDGLKFKIKRRRLRQAWSQRGMTGERKRGG